MKIQKIKFSYVNLFKQKGVFTLISLDSFHDVEVFKKYKQVVSNEITLRATIINQSFFINIKFK
jgi:hypothetical protein